MKEKINEKDLVGFEKVLNYIQTEQKGRGLYRFNKLSRIELQILKKVDLGEGKVEMKFFEVDKKDIKQLLKTLNDEIKLTKKMAKKGLFTFIKGNKR